MIFIAGASGFTGGHLTASFLSSGMAIKCLVRSEKTATSLSEKGAQTVYGDITDAGSLKGILGSDDIVIHLVGIMEEKGDSTFHKVHVEGTRNLVNEAKRAGVRHFFYQSALGADKRSWSGYLRTKEEAEDIVKQSGLSYTIFRPSLIIGPWDNFTKKLVDIIRFSPVIPVPGDGKAKFQPIYVKDWAKCLEKVMDTPEKYAGSFDIAGPEHLTYREIIMQLSTAMGSSKPIVTIPIGFMKFTVGFFDAIMIRIPVNRDQLRLLEQDNISDIDTVERNFGFVPIRYSLALNEFIRKK